MRTRDVRILDSVARKKRNDKWIEGLNRDNFQNDQGDAKIQILDQLEKERTRRNKLRKGSFDLRYVKMILTSE